MYGSDTTFEQILYEDVESRRGCKLRLRRNGMPVKQRRFTILPSFGPEHNLGVFNNSVDSIVRMFTERYFFCKSDAGARNPWRRAHDVASKEFKSKWFKQFRKEVMSHMPRLPKLSRQQVVDCYKGPKRKIYEQALNSLTSKPLEARDAWLSTFVKLEKQDLSKAPRGIQPRSSRFNLVLGQYLKHAEKKFFHAINKVFGKRTRATVIKGFNADVSAQILRSKWDLFKNPVALGLDASKFDMHVCIWLLMYEHSFYTALFPGSEELAELLEQQLHNQGIAFAPDGSVKFKVQGTRASGDLNTSLGNCILMCAMVWVLLKKKGINAELVNNGDDCVVILEEDDVERFNKGLEALFRHWGFSMVVEPPVRVFEQIEFCQTRPVLLPTGWRMVRNHDAVLRKDPMCVIPIPTQDTYKKWLWAVGTCGVNSTGGVPVQNAFYRCYLRNGSRCTTGMYDYVHKNTGSLSRLDGLDTTQSCITPEARVSYYYAFGIMPDEQVELERFYDSGNIYGLELSPINRDQLIIEPGISLLNKSI